MNSDDRQSRRRQITKIKGLLDFGLILVLIFFGAFGGWAISVPLSGAVIASGKVVKQGRSQQITHETGGVVADIKVREGDVVHAGDILAVLDDVERRSLRDRHQAMLEGLNIRLARLQAEQQGKENFVYETQDKDLATLIDDQKRQFAARLAAHSSKHDMLIAQKSAMLEELEGVKGELKALEVQLKSLEKETKLRREIDQQGYGRAADLRRFERELAATQAQMARLQTKQHSLPHNLMEVKKRLETLDSEFQEDLSKELAEVRREIVDIQKQLKASESAFRRVEVTAPVDGVVSVLHINTIGSAVAAFKPIADIVPEAAPVIVEVEVDPIDIDDVQVDRKARVVLSAFDADKMLPVEATTVFVSPDQLVRERDGRPYFVVRLVIDRDKIANFSEIKVGMPVEAYLKTEERTFAQLLFQPITDSMRRSFRG